MRVWANVGFPLLRCVPWLLGTIVIGGLLSQWVVAQRPRAVLAVDDRLRTDAHRDLRRELQQWFDLQQQSRWVEGFRVVDAMGSSAVPLVWKLLRDESNTRLRLLLIGAVAVADNRAEESRFLAEDWLARAGRSEQVMALLALAIGPRRAGDGDAVRRLVLGSREVEVVQIAGCLALARFVDAEPLPATFVPAARRDHAGLIAAAAASGVPMRSDLLERWWASKDATVQRQLVLRGCFLDVTGQPSTLVRTWAAATVAAAGVGASGAAVREAALWLAKQPDIDSAVPSTGQVAADLVVGLGSTAAGRRLVGARGWSRALRPVHVPAALHARLAVLHALTCAAGEVGDAVRAWREAPELQAPVCLALAWRRLSGDSAMPTAEWIGGLAPVPERAWLRWAAGLDAGDSRFEDAALQRAWTLALRGDLPPMAAASELEAALWRRGDHPGRTAHDARIELVRDLLLRGSPYVRARLADSEAFPYLPAGIPPGDDFYPVAYEFLLYLTQAAPAPPAEHRLAR